MRPVNLFEYGERAREHLGEMAWGYYVSGANDEVTLRENRRAFDRIELHYRVMAGIEQPSLSTAVLGTELELPVMVAPTAFHRLACEAGELATVRAAGRAGTAMIVSTLSTTAIEDITAQATGPVWFQLYVYRDRGATEALVRRAEAAGAGALVLTVDAPRLGRRERDVKSGFHLPHPLEVKNLGGTDAASLPPRPAESGLAAYVESLLDPALTWEDVGWLRSITDLPVLVKGVVRPDDAELAVEHGVDGIVVSNHGGRQLDTSPATIEVLGPIAEAVDGRAVLLVDGGVRRGTDVVKALALGARAVLIGRPILWGLAVDGERGAAHVLELLRDEIELALLLAGVEDARAVPRDLIG